MVTTNSCVVCEGDVVAKSTANLKDLEDGDVFVVGDVTVEDDLIAMAEQQHDDCIHIKGTLHATGNIHINL